MLLNPAEKDLDLPTCFIHQNNLFGSNLHQNGNHPHLAILVIMKNNHTVTFAGTALSRTQLAGQITNNRRIG
ncbi:hypothetical protein D3C81_1002550 [compost metagenome]